MMTQEFDYQKASKYDVYQNQQVKLLQKEKINGKGFEHPFTSKNVILWNRRVPVDTMR